MQLLLNRLIAAWLVSATLIAQAGLSHGQQDDSSLVVAVLDVQKVLDSMPELRNELKAADELEALIAKRKNFICSRKPSPNQLKTNALAKAYTKLRTATAEIAEYQNINLVVQAQTSGLSNGDSLNLEQVDIANETKLVYQDSLNLTQAVIERLQQTDKPPLVKQVEEDEKPNR